MKKVLADAAIVIAVLAVLALIMAAAGKTLPLASYFVGGSIGLTTAAARGYRRHLEAQASQRALAARTAGRKPAKPKGQGKAS